MWWKLGVYGLFCFDILMHAFGADCMVEDGSVVIIGNSITTTDRVKEKDLPLPPRGWASWRVSLYDFRVKFKVLSTNASHVMITFVLDPKVRAKELINYAIKKCAGTLLFVFSFSPGRHLFFLKKKVHVFTYVIFQHYP